MAKKTSPSIKELRERAFILIEIFRNRDAEIGRAPLSFRERNQIDELFTGIDGKISAVDVIVQRARRWESEK